MRKHIQSFATQEEWEELLKDSIGNVLRLRRHTNSLSADVHAEDFTSPNPSRRTPRWLIKENEQE
jgi:hypothetical protein